MHDVAVVGAGPVGTVAALELIQRGLDVVVLERRAEPRHATRSIGIHPPALTVLDRLGCGSDIVAAGVRVREGEVRCDGELLGRLSFREASPHHPYVLSVPQHATERMLRTRLRRIAPDALVTSCEVRGAEDFGSHVRLHTTTGTFEAKWVVGADGPRSVMRTLGRFAAHEGPYPDRYVMGDAADTTGLGELAVLFLEGDGVVESFPLPDGQRRWVVHRGHDPAPLEPREFAAVVARRTGVALDPDGIAATSAFGVRHAWVTDAARGRIVLVGDAAHEISPIGGQGMTLGWLDATELARVLAGALDGAAGDAFTAYRRHAARRQAIAARQAHFNTVMGRPVGAATLAARKLLVRGIALPVFEHRVARVFTMAAPAATAG